MNKITLLPHNEEGYVDLVECLKINQLATLNRATGTGKSFIGLKYAYANRDKRILVLAPTYPILDQWFEEHMAELGISKKEFKKFDGMIYSNLLKIDNMEELASKYDIVIVDEYHRCGSKKWGRKVRELRDALLKDPDKRMIGLTATEIRYLDKNRNMKDILFDGIDASRLSLADAILKGILPAPYYINCDLEIIDEVNATIKRVNVGLPSYCEEKKKIIEELNRIKKSLEKELFDNNDLRRFIKKGEKYLVFSSTKESIKEDSERMKSFFEDIPIEEYEVHYGQGKEKNKEILEKFKKVLKEKASILYSIAILNEGVHVKSVYGIFMCRKTTSPIIYFQQMGRLLSFSRRKDQVVIFDLVGNLKNHNVIYNLYNEVINRAKKLLETDPKNSERYKKIISNFKILDKSSDVLKQLERINKEYSKENLIRLRLLSDIKELELNKNLSYICKFQIERDFRNYYKYVDLELFSKIKQLTNISKPSLFELSVEEFNKMLKGYKSINDMVNNKYSISFEKMEKYIGDNYEIPSLFSEDEDEQELAVELYNNFKKYSRAGQKYIRATINESTSLYERISYGEFVEDIDYSELIDEINQVIKLKLIISRNVINILKSSVIREKCSNKKQIFEIIQKLEKYNKTILLTSMMEDYEEQNFSNFVDKNPLENSKQTEFIMKNLEESIDEKGLEEVLKEQFLRIEKFIKKYESLPTYKKTLSFSEDENLLSNELYIVLKILEKAFDAYGYMDKIDNIVLQIKIDATNKIIEKIIEFIEKNDGLIPSSRSKDLYESSLGNYLNRIIRKNNPEAISKLKPYLDKFEESKQELIKKINDFDELNIDESEIMEISTKYKKYFSSVEISSLNSNIRLKRIINFMLSHNYELPSIKSFDSEEKDIARMFSYIKNNLTTKQFEILGKYLSKQEQYKEIFIKKYIDFLEKNGKIPSRFGDSVEASLADSWCRWEPYIEKEKILKIQNSVIIKKLIKFMEEHNYEMPAQNNFSKYEQSLAHSYSKIKNKLDDENKNRIEQYFEIREEKKKEFIKKYIEFISKNGALPTIIDNQDLVESYNRWLPYLTIEEKTKIRNEEYFEILLKFLVAHNYEMPSFRNEDYSEQQVAHLYSIKKELFEPVLEEYREQIMDAKERFIRKYCAFINENNRMPIMNDEEERNLIFSYNRWLPYLTKEEQEKLKIKKVSKMEAMAKAYEMMKKKK